jgi:hypothetical protein
LGENPYASLGRVAEGSVESFGRFVFDLYFNIRYLACRATFVRCRKEGRSHPLASGFRSYVEVFDAGEEGARRDVGAVGEYGHAQYLAFGSGGEYIYVSGFDGLA